MLLNVFLIIVALSLILLFLSYYFKKKIMLLGLFSGVVLIILSLILFNSPLEYTTGSISETIGSVATSNIITTEINSNLNSIVSWVLLLAGFYFTVKTAIDLYSLKYDDYEKEYVTFK